RSVRCPYTTLFRSDRVESGAGGRQDPFVLVGEFTGLGDVPDVLGGHGHGTVDQVAPGGHQFVVVAPYELGPREIGVVGLGAGGHDEVPQRIGRVAFQEVPYVDHHAAGGGELLSLHGEELTGDHLGGHVQFPEHPGLVVLTDPTTFPQQDRGPDDRVEDDVVLAHEVEGLGTLTLPPTAPGLRVTDAFGPLDRGRQVSDDSV